MPVPYGEVAFWTLALLIAAAVGRYTWRLSKRMRRYRRRADRLEEQQGDLEAFTAAAAHDLRAPARTIANLAGLAKRRLRTDPAGAEKALDAAIEAAHRMDDVVAALLEYSHASIAKVRPRPIQAAALADDVVRDLAHEADVVIHGDMHIHGDDRLVRQALQNLVDNAVKYQSKPWVRIRIEDTPTEGRIRVVDRGPGIPRSEQERILQAFERGSTAINAEGTGLGLATVARIMEVHGGRIDVHSEPGQGSTFTLAFPHPVALEGTLEDGTPAAELSKP